MHSKPLFCSVIMALGVYSYKSFISSYGVSDYYILSMSILIGVLLYSLATLFVWAFTGYKDGPEKIILLTIKNKIIKKIL